MSNTRNLFLFPFALDKSLNFSKKIIFSKSFEFLEISFNPYRKEMQVFGEMCHPASDESALLILEFGLN
jgi:type II restriction/modification system DNA methylase subunit YeeA